MAGIAEGLRASEAERLRKAGFSEAAIREIDAVLRRNPGYRRRRWWRAALTALFAVGGFLVAFSGTDEWWGPALGGALGGIVGYLAGWVVETFATERDHDADVFVLSIAGQAMRGDEDALKKRAEALRAYEDPARPADAGVALGRLAAAAEAAERADGGASTRWVIAGVIGVVVLAGLALIAIDWLVD